MQNFPLILRRVSAVLLALACCVLAMVIFGEVFAPIRQNDAAKQVDKLTPVQSQERENTVKEAFYRNPPLGEPAAHFGYVPDPVGSAQFKRTLQKPLLRDAAPHLFRDDTQDVFLYRALHKQYRKTYGKTWLVEEQGIGDCVSWGWAHGVAIHLAVQCELGFSSEFRFPSTESIYGGSRVEARGRSGDGVSPLGGWSDGSYGSAAAKFVTSKNCTGGILWRQKYDFADLTKYSSERAKQWGAYGCGGKGDNQKADKEANKFPVLDVALVTTFEEAAAAIRSGYPVPVCSMQGFSNRRNDQGFAAPSGSWAHCMCFIGVRSNPPGLLCLNSWGPDWIKGGKYPDDQPEGSFWVDARVCTRMLSGEDSFAISSLTGFPFQPLNNGDWVKVELPVKQLPEHDLTPIFVMSP